MTPIEQRALDALALMETNPKLAEEMLDKLTAEYPNETVVRRVYGRIKSSLRKDDDAYVVLSRLVEENPEHEWDSISLFMNLYRLGDMDKAFAEIERFVNVTGTYTDDYDLVVADMRGEIDGDEYDRRMAEINLKKANRHSPNN